jgi:hypothetical protein
MDFSDYLRKMSRSGEWGDHVTLQAAADAYRVKIVVLTSFKDTCYIEILPTSQESKGGKEFSFTVNFVCLLYLSLAGYYSDLLFCSCCLQ